MRFICPDCQFELDTLEAPFTALDISRAVMRGNLQVLHQLSGDKDFKKRPMETVQEYITDLMR